LSNLFRVPRPSGDQIQIFRHLQVGSLPSGHVMQTVGAWGLLFALGCIPLWHAVLATLLVTLGRLYLGMHFVADVVSAWALGALLVWGFRHLWPALWSWLQQRSFRSWLTVAAVLAIAGVAWLAVMGGVPRRYEVMGMVVGSAIALPIEARFIGYRPPHDGRVRALVAVVGFLGILSLLLLDRSAPESARLLGFFTAGGTALWIFLVAPQLGTMAEHRTDANDSSETN
ncbi:MAG TPA: phosphatase PAP2 family protein, partial [Longimicrobiaceae bacterium]|nr:phosphatase PAP2 family protein [Longimicrobiaceae bacterium]